MEFTNEISFNDKLIENKIAKINYHGRLFKNGSQSLTIVYGFGNNWEYTQEKQMNKVENGFEVEVEIKPYDTFNFCFRDENYNWDNNNSFNYISPIEKVQEVLEPVEIQDSNEDAAVSDTQQELKNLEKEISLLFDELFDSSNENTNQKTITPSFIPYDEKENSSDNFDLDALIEEILNPVIASSDSAAVLENVATEIDEPIISNNVENEVSEFPTHTQKTSTLVEDILVPFYEEVKPISNAEEEKLNNIDNLIETLAENTKAAQVQETPAPQQFHKIENIEELFETEDIKNPEQPENIVENKIEDKKVEENIVAAAVVETPKKDFTVIEDEPEVYEPSLLEEVTQEKENSRVEENVALSVVKEQNDFLVSPRKLNKFYFIKKKIKLAFYKALVSIPKFLHKQFDSSENN